jgi:hypothetical protein
MTLQCLWSSISRLFAGDPLLRFVPLVSGAGESYVYWNLVNSGGATKGDVLVAEFGAEGRLINYVNIGPVAASAIVTLPPEHFPYCISLQAEYGDSEGRKLLTCTNHCNIVRCGGLSGAEPLKAYPRIRRRKL